MRTQSEQRGIGLLELMLSLAIVAVLLVIVGRYYAATSFSQNANAVQTQFIEISQALYRYKALKGTWEGVKLSDLKPWLNQTFTASFDETGAAPGPFQGTNYEVLPYQNKSTTQETVLIRLAGFTSDPNDTNSECARLANRIQGALCPNGNSLDYCYPTSPCW
jgi:Tfp pilus assembly protein PilE